MKTVVVLRQLPDLIEPLEIADSGTALDLDGGTFVVNEYDDHAMEQALLLKESAGGEVIALALDFGDVDDTLYAASAKGTDQIVKLAWEEEAPPSPSSAAAMFAEVVREMQPDLVLVGGQSYDELEGSMAPLLAMALGWPYVGVVRGVKVIEDGTTVRAFKEFPGAVTSEMNVTLPAVLGILAADQPPRYVPVSRIRSAMKSAAFDRREALVAAVPSAVTVQRLYPPESGERAEILEGTDEETAARIAAILEEKGLSR